MKSKLAEHKKYRRQCQVRIKSGIKLILVLLVIGAVVLFLNLQFWPFVLGVIVFFVLATLLEVWGYRKHDRAIKQLDA